MEEKKQGPPNLDDEITSIETDFNVIFRELAQYSYIGNYGNVFRQLRTLLIDSHKKNQELAKVVQNLNQQIISNATRVQSLLKMSENDTLEIEKYKASYEKVLGLVSVSQAKEVWAKDLCEGLKKKIGELSSMVAEQSKNENNAKQLQLDLLNYDNEAKCQTEEMKKINRDTEDIRNQTEKNKEATIRAGDQIQLIEETIKIEEDNYAEIKASNDVIRKEIDQVQKENNELTLNGEKIIRDMGLLKKQLWQLRQELQNQRDIEIQYKNESEKVTRSLHSKIYKRDQLLRMNSKLENKIHYTSVNTDRAMQDLDKLQTSISELNQLLDINQKEFDEVTEKSETVHGNLTALQQKKKDSGFEITKMNRKVAFTSAKNHEITREADSTSRMIQNINVQIDEAKVVTEQEKNMNKLVKANLSSKKKEIQQQDFTSANYEKEMMIFIERANNIKTQLLRFDDNIKLLKMENDNAEENLKKLSKSLHDHDILNRETRYERDHLATRVIAIERDNENWQKQLNEQIKAVEELKQKKSQQAEDIINTHFQTRGFEKQIQTLQSFINVTNEMYTQALATIVGYKAEGQKLRLILEEARKDIQSAKGEIFNIKEMKRIIHNQIHAKNDSIDKDTQNSITLSNELRNKQLAAIELAKQTGVLGEELEKAVSKYQYLSKKIAAIANLKVLIVRLETQVAREREFKNACISEFYHPQNVHRWTLMKHIHPEHYKKIQLVDYLKTKIEEVQREQMKLDEQKQNLMQQIKSGKATIKGCKIMNGINAINVYKNDLASKEKEIEAIKKEIEDTIQQRQEIAEAIELLRNKLKQGYIATPNIRKQIMMNLPYQKHHTVTGLDKTRLGGGFNINPENNINNSKVQTPRFFLTEAKTDETEPISSRSDKNLTNTRPKSSMKTNLTATNMKVKIRPSSAINSKPTITNNVDVNNVPNFATVEITTQLNNKRSAQNGKELKTPRKKHIKAGKVALKKQEESVNTPRIEFHNSQLSARRAKEEPRQPPSAASKPSSRPNSSALPNSSWKPKSVIKPTVGPYFGPL